MSLINMKSGGFVDEALQWWEAIDIELSSTPTNLKTGSNIYVERKQLMVINDSSDLVYIGLNEDLTVANSQITLYSGQALTFNFDRTIVLPIYAVLEEGTNSIRIIELK